MKTAKKAGIICWSLVAILLIVVVVVGIIIGPQKIFNDISLWSEGMVLNIDNAKEVSTYSVPVKDFDNIDINWESGYIKLYVYDGDEIQITERSIKKLDDDEKMTYKVKNNTLKIEGKSRFEIGFLCFRTTQKILEVKIPQNKLSEINKIYTDTASSDVFINDLDLKELAVSTTSGIISIENIKSENINIDTTSGDIALSSSTVDKNCSVNSTSGYVDLKNCSMSNADVNTTSGDITLTSADIKESCITDSISGNVILIDCVSANINADTTSGDVKANGEFSTAKCDTVSGDISISSKTVLTDFSCSTTSGDTILKIPVDTKKGFTANVSTVSGEFICNLPLTSNGDIKVYGNGEYSYRFDSTSGDVSISSVE